jgi:hypothetical protein
MADILDKFSAGASHFNEAGFDGNRDTFWDFEYFGLKDVPHLCGESASVWNFFIRHETTASIPNQPQDA